MKKNTCLKLVKQLPLLLILLSSSLAVQAQVLCGTQRSKNSGASQRTSSFDHAYVNTCSFQTTNCYTVRIFFHFVNRSNGTGGHPHSIIPELMKGMNLRFAPHKIYLAYAGTDDINDDQYYSNNFSPVDPDDPQFVALTTGPQAQSNAINAYIFGDEGYQGGMASGFVGTSFIVGGTTGTVPNESFVNPAVLAHEVGHCLGLYHTYEDHYGAEDGANGCTAGDLVPDTKPENNQGITCNPSDCRYYDDVTGLPYKPTVFTLKNIMDAIPFSCMESFTAGQGNRMKYFLTNNSILGSVYTNGFTVPSLVWQSAPQPDNKAQFTIVNYIPPGNGVTYTITNKSNSSVNDPTSQYFEATSVLTPADGFYTGSFTFNTTSTCGSTSSAVVVRYLSASGNKQEPDVHSTEVLTASPNPVRDYLILPETATQIILFNALGQEVRRADASRRLDVQQLPVGFYQLRMKQQDKVIMQRIEVR